MLHDVRATDWAAQDSVVLPRSPGKEAHEIHVVNDLDTSPTLSFLIKCIDPHADNLWLEV